MEVIQPVMPLIDITAPLSSQCAPWPGDTPVSVTHQLLIEDGESVNLSSLTMSLHSGTHVDAPWHFSDTGARLDDVDLSVYVGPAVVVDVRGHGLINAGLLNSNVTEWTPRVLLRTGSWTDRTIFPHSIPVLTPDAIDLLVAKKVILLGVDLPSVDAIDSKDLPNHNRLLSGGIHILESAWLEEAVPGSYELIALPLKISGVDASPVRAILRV